MNISSNNLLKRSTPNLGGANNASSGRRSTTSRGKMMTESLWQQKPGSFNKSDYSSNRFMSVIPSCLGLIRRLLIPVILCGILAVFGFFIYDEYTAFPESDIIDRPNSRPMEFVEPITIPNDSHRSDEPLDMGGIRDYVANLSKSYIQHELDKNAHNSHTNTQIDALYKELDSLRRDYREMQNKNLNLEKTEKELQVLKQKLVSFEQLAKTAVVNERTSGTDLDSDWALMKLGATVKVTKGMFDRTKGIGVFERMAMYLQRRTTSEELLDHRLALGPTNSLLQYPKTDLTPGDCFPLDPDGATLHINLPMAVQISSVVFHHLPTVLRAPDRMSAPKKIEVTVLDKIVSAATDIDEQKSGILGDIINLIRAENNEQETVVHQQVYQLEWRAKEGREVIQMDQPIQGSEVVLGLSSPIDNLDYVCIYRLSINGVPTKPKL